MSSNRYAAMRINKRYSVTFSIVGHGKNTFIDGTVNSLSQQGAMISLKNSNIEIGEKVFFIILSNDGRPLWRVHGIVKQNSVSLGKTKNLIIIFENKIMDELTINTEKEI